MDARITLVIEEARRQHEAFGGQTVERNGAMFVVGYNEGEWSAWQRVAQFWRALDESQPPTLMTSAGRVHRAQVAGAEQPAVRESLLRAAILDTPWSAAFISYLMKTAGFTRAEFEFSDSHADYVRGAFDASAAEAQGRDSAYAYRACNLATTRPRPGDLICATRAGTSGIASFDALAAAMAQRPAQRPFPMHCDLVVKSDEGGDAKLEAIGGNVVNAVTLTKMSLNAKKVLGAAHLAQAAPLGQERLGRRPWVVVLQFRH